jgi:hypothetical protein
MYTLSLLGKRLDLFGVAYWFGIAAICPSAETVVQCRLPGCTNVELEGVTMVSCRTV